MSVELLAFLDLVAELIATAVWQGAGGGAAPDETLAARPDGQDNLPPFEAGNVGPIPSFPADCHDHSHSSPATPARAPRKEGP